MKSKRVSSGGRFDGSSSASTRLRSFVFASSPSSRSMPLPVIRPRKATSLRSSRFAQSMQTSSSLNRTMSGCLKVIRSSVRQNRHIPTLSDASWYPSSRSSSRSRSASSMRAAKMQSAALSSSDERGHRQVLVSLLFHDPHLQRPDAPGRVLDREHADEDRLALALERVDPVLVLLVGGENNVERHRIISL